VLYLVPTPIGNLEDITLRGIRVLNEADLILAEDTRRTRHLLSHLKISRPVESFYAGAEEKRSGRLISLLIEGKNLALVTDSGTPALSDPGALLVRKAHEAGIKVISLPGPSALTSAWALSGFPESDFVFMGFLPKKKSKLRKKIERCLSLNMPVVFFESPARIKKTLDALADMGEHLEIAMAREISKIHEEYWRGPVSDLRKLLDEREVRGEFTLIVRKQESCAAGPETKIL